MQKQYIAHFKRFVLGLYLCLYFQTSARANGTKYSDCFRITLHITFNLRKHTVHLCVINHFTSEITEFAKLTQRIFSNGKKDCRLSGRAGHKSWSEQRLICDSLAIINEYE